MLKALRSARLCGVLKALRGAEGADGVIGAEEVLKLKRGSGGVDAQN